MCPTRQKYSRHTDRILNRKCSLRPLKTFSFLVPATWIMCLHAMDSKMSFLLGVPVSDFPQTNLLTQLYSTNVEYLICGFSKNLFSYVQLKQCIYLNTYICKNVYNTNMQYSGCPWKTLQSRFSFKLFKQQTTLLIENLKINLRIVFCVLGITKRFGISRLCPEKHDKLIVCLLYFF